ncbi:hypothetical protein C812_02417 [Paenibacillus barengoltzii G22]|uniref:Uncharacterized protein n=1 Tax=Paenibacillus barengoltzii G22 TaxID=1235795 RepID=R9LJC2_9BACL|nr:hypothetical protein C812_02417 [Paenibacillus barengoltzii G22]
MELLEWLILAVSPLVLFFKVSFTRGQFYSHAAVPTFSEIKSGNQPTAHACRYIGSPNVYYSNQR